MTTVRRTVFLAGLLLLSCQIFADGIDDLAKKRIDDTGVPGLSITVVRNGKVIKSGAYGYSDIENKVRVKPETVFEIGSISKMFTSIGILQLVAEKKMGLDDAVEKHWNEAPDAWKKLTIRQLLSHTSGISEYLGINLDLRKDYRENDLLEIISKLPHDFEPGVTWSYSNGGYVLAAALLGKAGGDDWDDVIEDNIFKKLDMERSFMQSAARVVPDRARGYTKLGKTYNNQDFIRTGSAHGAGAVVSNGPDMAKWAIALDEATICQKDILDQAFEPIKLKSGRTFDYGLGFFIREVAGKKVVEHGGNTFGFSAQITRIPEEKLTVIVLGNLAGQSYTGFSVEIAEQVLGKFPKPTLPDEKEDPDQSRRNRVIDAVNSLLSGEMNPSLVDEEARAFFGTTRGAASRQAAGISVGKVKAIRLLSDKKEGQDTELRYKAYCTRGDFIMTILWSNEGKVVRLSLGPAG
ncbi:serine hydrolase domain-containing protein [Kamptonema cortianum]|nr:serine hydrolase domain-containing protein [Geitlerinema splendidum]MDK3158541.1 serine hydrolase domain-containing protein [Kamptonema cortianum]